MANQKDLEALLRLNGLDPLNLSEISRQANSIDKIALLSAKDSLQSLTNYKLESLNSTLRKISNFSELNDTLIEKIRKAQDPYNFIEFSKHRDHLNQSYLSRLSLDIDSISSISKDLASRVPAISSLRLAEDVWANRLAKQMSAVSEPWIHSEYASLSLEGFAVASRLGHAVRMPELYGEAAADQIDEDLGLPVQVDDDAGPEERDEAHLEAGMNASLLAFPPPALPSVLVEAGFELTHEFAPIPVTTDNSDPGHTFHPGNFNLIVTVEQNLRRVIETEMTRQYGVNWVQSRVSQPMQKEWSYRYEAALAHGESPLNLIQYSNFMDLKDIVIQRLHWREVFEDVFKKKDHFSMSMERLHPIRLPLSHSRPIGAAQQINLISEAGIILKALGVDIYKRQ